MVRLISEIKRFSTGFVPGHIEDSYTHTQKYKYTHRNPTCYLVKYSTESLLVEYQVLREYMGCVNMQHFRHAQFFLFSLLYLLLSMIINNHFELAFLSMVFSCACFRPRYSFSYCYCNFNGFFDRAV